MLFLASNVDAVNTSPAGVLRRLKIRIELLPILVLIALSALVSCGRPADDTLTVASIVRRTGEWDSAKIAGTIARPDSRSVINIRGDADPRRSRYRFAATARNSALEWIVIGTHGFVRGATDSPRSTWCSVPAEDSAQQLGVDPTSVLRSVAGGSAGLHRLGTSIVRGVATTHFRINRDNDSAVEVWVDKDDLLRRYVGEQDGTSATIEFYDFGSTITPITYPSGARPCALTIHE
jgi:hypothetical protein